MSSPRAAPAAAAAISSVAHALAWTSLAAASICVAQDYRFDFERAAARENGLRARLRILEQEELALVASYNACIRKAAARDECDPLIPTVLGKVKERDDVKRELQRAEAETDLVLNEAEATKSAPFGAVSFRACLLADAQEQCMRRFAERLGSSPR